MKYFTKVFTSVLAAGGMLVLGSCVSENLDNCPTDFPDGPNVRMRIVTDYERQNPGLDPSTRVAAGLDWYAGQIESIAVLVFDEAGKFITLLEGGPYTMWQDYTMDIQLEAGQTYRFVAWSNYSKEEYELSDWQFALAGGYTDNDPITGLPRQLMIGDMTMDLVFPDASRTFTADIPHRHQGEESISVFDNNSLHGGVLEIGTHTYKVNYILKGLDTNHEYGVKVTDYNTRHKITGDRQVVVDENPYFHTRDFVTTYPGSNYDMSVTEASVRLLQITDSTGEKVTSFEIVDNTDDVVLYPSRPEHDSELLDMIRKAYRITSEESMMALLKSVYEFNIEFTFGASMDVEISINGYKYVEQGTDL